MNIEEALSEIASAIDITKDLHYVVYSDNCTMGENNEPCNECRWALEAHADIDMAFSLIQETIRGTV